MAHDTFRLYLLALLAGSLAAGVGDVQARGMGVPTAAAPSKGQISERLAHTVEIGIKGTHFRSLARPLTIRDGRGTGTLTAVVGTRWPTADALGQVVFFWHNRTFIGQSANYETPSVRSLRSPAAGTFAISYTQYKSGDPVCCPTVRPSTVIYGWSGTLLISNGVPPRGPGKAVRVRYQP